MKSKPVVEVDFVQLSDGTLLETIEDPSDPTGTLLAVYRDKTARYADQFETDDRIWVPLSRSAAIFEHMRFARGAKPYESANNLLTELVAIILACLDLSTDQAILLACFILSTWVPEKLPIAPYVAFVGLPRSGKTTALRLLDLLCRRSLLTSDVTSASFYEAFNRVTPTILIDETATAGDRRALFHLLRVGSTRGSVAIRKNKAYNAYGPKVVCWTELPSDAALNSRCIIIPLQETDRRNLPRPTDPKVLALADCIRQMLQQYRFENFNQLSLTRVPGDERLSSRSRDLYEALALPIADPETRKFLARQFQLQQNFNREPLSPIQIAVLRVLETYIHENVSDSTFANRSLTDSVNLKLSYDREFFRPSPHQVGHVLTTFGLTERKRTNTGWVLLLSRDTRDKIHKLVRRYGVEIDSSVNREGCDFCMGRENEPAREPSPEPETTPLSEKKAVA
jgi:hypothetical protein